jgi:hypothetical protein
MRGMAIYQAREIEKQLMSDLSVMGDDFIALTQTFKDSQLRRLDSSCERTKKVGHTIRQTCQHKDFNIRLNNLSFFIKDEIQHSNGHCHTVIWTDELKKRNIDFNYFLNVLHGYWSAPFETYKDDSWSNLKDTVTEPKVGWMRSCLPETGTSKNLLQYQTKFLKNDKIVGVNYHASERLVKKLNSSNQDLYILQRN